MPFKRPRKRWLLAAAAIAAAAGLLLFGRGDAGHPPAPSAAAAPSSAPRFFGRVAGAAAVAAPVDRASRLRELTERFQLADQTYCSYREASKYPAGSRPIAQQPDQAYPNRPVTDTHDMRNDGGGSDPKVQIQTSQSRVYMAAGEAVAFSLRAVDPDGRVLPLQVTRAVAQGLTFGRNRPSPQVAIAFADDGKGPDPVAGDGAFAAVLAPSQTALAAFDGTIRTEVRYSVGGRPGRLQFDVIYSPELPAVWTGQVREALENGSLNFYLKAEVRKAGRYIVSGRVDDAAGQPVALLTFNDVLPAGPNEVRLTMFGKLMRDQQPAPPLTLRDVDGYLLKENADPDRALMPRLEGKVYVSQPRQPNNFSDAEWEGEQRSRYLTEFGKDLAQARAALAEFDPGAPPPKSACSDTPPANQR